MIERKQSFLERLTGAQVFDGDDEVSDGKVRLQSRATSQPQEKSDANIEAEMREMYQETNDDEEEVEAGLAIDMYESDNELIIQCMIAGVTTENLQVSITRDTVIIRGERIPPHGIPSDGYITRELYWGVFSREIDLPYEINADGAEAVEKFGLLIIRLPRLDANRAQELKVKSI